MPDAAQQLMKIEAKTDVIVEHVNRVKEILDGDGTNFNPGLLIRLDRIERLQNFFMRFFWIVVVAIVTQAVILSYAAVRWLMIMGTRR